MNLNNKGFAFSTMLYGILTMMILMLMLIFGLMKYYNDENYYYSSEVELKLNNCVFEEIALENCYSSGGICDTSAYYSCMGFNTGDYVVENGLASVIRDKAVTSGDGLYVDQYNAGGYVFRGNNVNNYIKYAGLDWRIVAVNVDGTLKLIYTGYDKKLPWDVDGTDEWKVSSLNNYLKDDFYAKIIDTSGFLSNASWNVGWVYPTFYKRISGNCDSVDPDEAGAVVCDERYSIYTGTKKGEGVIGLLNVSDYYNAAISDDCKNDTFGGHDCSSWLSRYPTWLLNPEGDATSVNPANRVYRIDEAGTVTLSEITIEQSVVPTVYLDSMIYVSGDGTASNPYVVK